GTLRLAQAETQPRLGEPGPGLRAWLRHAGRLALAAREQAHRARRAGEEDTVDDGRPHGGVDPGRRTPQLATGRGLEPDEHELLAREARDELAGPRDADDVLDARDAPHGRAARGVDRLETFLTLEHDDPVDDDGAADLTS